MAACSLDSKKCSSVDCLQSGGGTEKRSQGLEFTKLTHRNEASSGTERHLEPAWGIAASTQAGET